MWLFTLMREALSAFDCVVSDFSFHINADFYFFFLWQHDQSLDNSSTFITKNSELYCFPETTFNLSHQIKYPASFLTLCLNLDIKRIFNIYIYKQEMASVHFCTSTFAFLIVFVFLPHFTVTH